MRKGHAGSTVKAFQEALKEQGYLVCIDGLSGEEASHELKRFQVANGLQDDGIAGPQTFKALTLKQV